MKIINIIKNRGRVLGQNERNLVFIREYNLPSAKKIADDKLLTKKTLSKNEIPTPKLIASIKNFDEYNKFDWNSLPVSFVIKPVRGTEGAGIEIFYNKDKNGNWIRADKSKFTLEDLKRLASDILEGRFTPYTEPDKVIFEERVKPHKAFKYYTYKGTPDVRIIVFNKIPVLAYLRLPTEESKGKANLAQGAIGVGIDISNGTTTTAVLGKGNGGRGEIIKYVPGTRLSLSGLKIPYWKRMLEIAVECQVVTKIGFLAVDFLVDREEGPKIVELTARPGLSIQIANQDGLRWRLRKARGIKVKSVAQGIRIGKDLFGGEIEEEIEEISGKQLIGINEDVTLYGLNGEEVELKVKVDTGADSSSIDTKVAEKLGYGEIIEVFKHLNEQNIQNKEDAHKFIAENRNQLIQKYELLNDINFIESSHGISLRPYINIKMKLGDLVYETKANVFDREHLNFKMIVGRKSLDQFLVEPSRKNITSSPKKASPTTPDQTQTKS